MEKRGETLTVLLQWGPHPVQGPSTLTQLLIRTLHHSPACPFWKIVPSLASLATSRQSPGWNVMSQETDACLAPGGDQTSSKWPIKVDSVKRCLDKRTSKVISLTLTFCDWSSVLSAAWLQLWFLINCLFFLTAKEKKCLSYCIKA